MRCESAARGRKRVRSASDAVEAAVCPEAVAFAMRVADGHGHPRPDSGEFGPADIIRGAWVVERADCQRR